MTTAARWGGARGYGYQPIPVSARLATPGAGLRLGDRVSAARSASIQQYGITPFDQVRTSSCVGCAVNRGAHTSLSALGVRVPFPSVRATYTGARVLDSGYPLQDHGSRPTDAAHFLRTFGLALQDPCPELDPTSKQFDPERFAQSINDEPDLELLSIASEYKVTGLWIVHESGSSLKDRFKQALDSKIAVCFATEVDSAFEANVGSIIQARTGPSLGGHYLCAVGYEISPNGKFYLRFANSWGTQWGAGGYGLADESFIERVTDVMIMDVSRVQ